MIEAAPGVPALYRRLLGAKLDVLPAQVRALHDVTAPTTWRGSAEVERGGTLLSRLLCALFRLPSGGHEIDLRVRFEPVDGAEIWTRSFGTTVFRSVQFQRGVHLCERLGPATLLFDPIASRRGLSLRLAGVRLFGVPVPRILHPRVATFEGESDGRYTFLVEAHLPLAGLLVRYSGWLMRDTRGDPLAAA